MSDNEIPQNVPASPDFRTDLPMVGSHEASFAAHEVRERLVATIGGTNTSSGQSRIESSAPISSRVLDYLDNNLLYELRNAGIEPEQVAAYIRDWNTTGDRICATRLHRFSVSREPLTPLDELQRRVLVARIRASGYTFGDETNTVAFWDPESSFIALCSTYGISRGSAHKILRMNGAQAVEHFLQGSDDETLLDAWESFPRWMLRDGYLGSNVAPDPSGYKLTQEQWGRLFFSEMKQRTTGNCGVIAQLAALDNSKYMEWILRRSIEQQGSRYRIHFPLGSSSPMSHVDITEPEAHRWSKGVDGEVLEAVGGGLGWKILEAAYAKKRYGSLDRTKIEGDFEGVASVLFEGFEHSGIIDCKGDRTRAEDALRYASQSSNVLLTAVSHTPSGEDPYEVFDEHGQSFYGTHGYAVKKVNFQQDRVRVLNPHDTGSSKTIVLSIAQFFDVFDRIQVTTLDVRGLAA